MTGIDSNIDSVHICTKWIEEKILHDQNLIFRLCKTASSCGKVQVTRDGRTEKCTRAQAGPLSTVNHDRRQIQIDCLSPALSARIFDLRSQETQPEGIYLAIYIISGRSDVRRIGSTCELRRIWKSISSGQADRVRARGVCVFQQQDKITQAMPRHQVYPGLRGCRTSTSS